MKQEQLTIYDIVWLMLGSIYHASEHGKYGVFSVRWAWKDILRTSDWWKEERIRIDRIWTY